MKRIAVVSGGLGTPSSTGLPGDDIVSRRGAGFSTLPRR